TLMKNDKLLLARHKSREATICDCMLRQLDRHQLRRSRPDHGYSLNRPRMTARNDVSLEGIIAHMARSEGALREQALIVIYLHVNKTIPVCTDYGAPRERRADHVDFQIL